MGCNEVDAVRSAGPEGKTAAENLNEFINFFLNGQSHRQFYK
jgi:hypothetical protein